MNIFKILANGHGSINEANVSAFIGYLLDPKADHALGDEFLKRFLEKIEETNENFENQFYNLDFQIFYEQAFKEEKNAKQIVDLIIVAYQTKMESGKEKLIHDFIENKKEIKKIYLIENKIRKGSITKGQLIKQYNSTIHQIPDNYASHVTSIYLTPDESKYDEEFKKAQETLNNAYHINWKSVNKEGGVSILEILYSLLKDEVEGKIEPLNEYTLHTIKAFCLFIENEFRSERQLNKAKKEGAFMRDLHNSIESYKEKYPGIVDEQSLMIIEAFIKHIDPLPSVSYRLSKTHPISVLYDNKKIFGLNKMGKSLAYDIVYRNYPQLEKLDSSINERFECVLYYENDPAKGIRVKPNNLTSDEVNNLFDEVLNQLTSA